ncbi:MFS transporter [Nostoc sp. CENA67]|uniref:MFS transporter n=1 Tax=Amazonocrinis nigriterrae CENA67 TaxID=2794033 RepID=A0A8J7HTM5_9NOST|nr:MFS transporter [Amazonocrinis nigriterrae]MBH8563568.1 MFS transporter [Amazonocrinis nigriterrae CENA67]
MNNFKVIQFLVSRFCSALGDQFLLFAVPLIIYKSTQNVSLVGLAFFIEWTPRVLSLPIAGSFSDRLGGKKVYLLADFVRMTVCLSGFLLINLFPSHIFIIVSLVMSICAFFYAQAFIAMESTVPKLVSKADLPKAQSILQGIDQTSSILGPALAAMLALYLKNQDFLFVAAGVFGLGFLGVISLGSALNVKIDKSSKKQIWRDVVQGAKVLLDYPNLLTLTALSILVNLIIGIALATGAPLITGTFNKPDSYFAVLNTTAGLLGVVSFLLVPKLIKHFSVFNLGITAYLAILCGGMLMGLANNFYLFVLGYALASGSTGLFNVYIRTERVQWIPSQHLGKTVGLIVLLNQLSLPAAGILVAIGSARVGTKSLFILSSLVAAAYIAWIYKRLKIQSKTNT